MKYLLAMVLASGTTYVITAYGGTVNGDAEGRTGAPAQTIVNPAIDMNGFLNVAHSAADHRESRRVTEKEFLRMSREPGTIVLDARSERRFNQLHVKGAINLSFPDIAIESLKETIPEKNTRILIYCNNNFDGPQAVKGANGPFPDKLGRASLNLSTYASLHGYGYKNVYELGPLIDLRTSKLEFEPREMWQAMRTGR